MNPAYYEASNNILHRRISFVKASRLMQKDVRKVEDFNYDFIILDINLADGSGLRLLKYLRPKL